jgi:hypothetical protein
MDCLAFLLFVLNPVCELDQRDLTELVPTAQERAVFKLEF